LFIPKLLPRRLDGTGPKTSVFMFCKLVISEIKKILHSLSRFFIAFDTSM
jgi:hypothetical protein